MSADSHMSMVPDKTPHFRQHRQPRKRQELVRSCTKAEIAGNAMHLNRIRVQKRDLVGTNAKKNLNHPN
jgi:hypothetical protein